MQVRRGMFVLAFTIVQFTVALRVPAAETLSSAAKARKVLDARGSERVAMQVMDAVMTSFRQSMTDLPPDFWTAVRERMHANELIDALVPIYQRNLSDSDLDSLLEFYDSPAGKRYVEKQPVIVRESLQVGQQWAERIVQEAVADLKTKERAPTATSDNAASPAPATPLTGTSSETKARRLLEAMSFDREATQFLDVVFSRLRQLRPDVRPDFWNALRARIHPQELIDLSIPIYQRNLSDDDLDELTRFFTSTAGRHFIEKQPAISEESMQAGQEWARKIVEPALMEVLAKKKQQEEHAAEPGGEMRVAAERGDAKAQRSLGRSYEWAEHGVAKDLAEAAKWYRKAADQGDAQAQYLLASLYARGGAGIPPDDAEAAKWYRKAAEQGHRQAQRELAFAYLIGMGVPRDLEEAAKWNRKAAEQGDTSAQVDLGNAYVRGEGVATDYTEAMTWYRKAADHGVTSSMVSIGDLYRRGQGVSKDPAEAARWYRMAADKGDAAAQRNLGMLYLSGDGVAKDIAEATKWYTKAAEHDDLDAQNVLADLYKNGKGVATDFAEAEKWYRKAAGKGDAAAQYNLGLLYELGEGHSKDINEAVKWFRKAAGQRYADAERKLANIYASEPELAKDDAEAAKWFASAGFSYELDKNYSEAAKWYRKAAAQGDRDSQNSLADLYWTGKGLPEDRAEAVTWYRKSAEQGLDLAQMSLGDAYLRGEGVAKDLAQAAQWYRKAAEQGYSPAQTALGNLLRRGEGVARDLVEAANWYRKAAAQDYRPAENSLGNAYRNGQGVTKDLAEAVKWYRKAAEAPRQNQSGNLESILSGPAGGKGFAPSQNNLGEVYQRGEGVTKDLEEAARWYRLAADQEYSAAQRNLGLLYQTGEGVVKDPAQAQRWLRKAAEQGDDDAQYDLGRMLLDEKGALKDRIEGREWLQEAAYQGNEKAKETLDKLRAGYPAASGAQTVPRVDVATGGSFTGEPIELRVANADVRGVLGMFAKVTDLNIVLDSRVRARITGDFAGPWDSILAKIIETNALTYKILGNAMAIGPKDSPLMDSALLTGTSNDNPVSITVSDARLQDVLDTFAKLGVNFNSGGVELDGSVTAFVADVPLMKLSRLILAANGYACDDQDGAVRIRPLKGIERFAGFAPSASRRCQAGACDDVQFMNLEGTLTPQKAGSQTVALFELSTDRYRVVTEGDTIGSTGRVIDAAAGKVIVSDRSGGRDLPSTFVIRTVPSP